MDREFFSSFISRFIRPGCLSVLMIAVAFITGCTPFSDKMKSWVGSPIERRLNIEGARELIHKADGPDSRGHTIYVEWVEKKCQVFWDVDSDGIIAEWRSEGSACKYYTN